EAFPAAFFGVFSGLQFAAAFLIPYAHRDLDWVWLGITAFLIAAYVVTRTVSVWPIGYIEDLDALGVISKVVEVLTALLLLSLMQSERVARRKTTKAAAASGRQWLRPRRRLPSRGRRIRTPSSPRGEGT